MKCPHCDTQFEGVDSRPDSNDLGSKQAFRLEMEKRITPFAPMPGGLGNIYALTCPNCERILGLVKG